MASENSPFLFADELGAAGVMMQHYGQTGGGKIVRALDGKENSAAGIKLPLRYVTVKAMLTPEENSSSKHLFLL